jgi:hypothetical protein
MSRKAMALVLVLFLVGFTGVAGLSVWKARATSASTLGVGGVFEAPQEAEGPDYNTQFTYVRIKYGDSGSDLRNFGYRGRGRGRGPSWAHDWPDAEINFSKILEATTFIDTFTRENSGRILTLDDPELFNYPVATIIEVGRWSPSDSEVENLRAYLMKGGFLIVDDTRQERGYEFQNFYGHMKRALPEYEIQAVPDDHEIFNSFFYIPEPLAMAPAYGRNAPVYLGIFEDNDPETGRLMVMINWNQDFQEYWEYSDRGFYPIDLSNEAYKFGVNYMIYAHTH